MEKSYEEITVYDLQILYETDLTAEIKLDADRKTVSIMSLSVACENLINVFAEAVKPILEKCAKAVQSIIDTFKPYMYKKLSKKRFIKLLQSEGIQRNEINKIVANNKEPYTHLRFLETLEKYKKR